MINFYRRFLSDATQVLAPLTNALLGPGKSLQWSPVLFSTFSAAKLLLASVPFLTHPVPRAAISLDVDASDSHVGAVLQQRLRCSWSPFAFFSKKLSSAESKYFAFDRELLAAYSPIHHFRLLFQAQDFTLFTDHKPLTLAFFCSYLPWSARQTCHLAYISEYTSNIVHIPGSENVDAMPCLAFPARFLFHPCLFSLPRLSISPPPVLISPPSLPCSCPALPSSLWSPIPLSPLSPYLFFSPPSSVICPPVPSSLCHQLFISLHELSHPGVLASQRLLSSKFV